MLNYLKRKFESGLFHLSRRSNYAFSPRSLILEITNDCNLHYCFMCPRNFCQIEKKNLSLEEFKYILEKLPKLKTISFVGLGEPLVNPFFYEMLNLGKSKNISFTVTTNGLLLTKENIKRLSNLTAVYVSLDTPEPERYKKIRGVNLEEVKNNLRSLKELKKEIRLVIEAIIMKDTFQSLPELVTLAREVKADKLDLSHLVGFNEELGRQHANNFPGWVSYLNQAKKLAKKYGISLTSRLPEPEFIPCWEPWVLILISVHGDIYPCSDIHRSEEPTYQDWYLGLGREVSEAQYKMGNIFKDNFNKIWNGKDYQFLRKCLRAIKPEKEISSEELNRRRKEIDLNKKFFHCQVCLYSWGCAC